MKNLVKNLARIAAIAAFCAAVSACSPQPIGSSSFPSSYGSVASSPSSAISIMDY